MHVPEGENMTDAELVSFVKALCAVGGSSPHVVVMERLDSYLPENGLRSAMPLYRVHVEMPNKDGARTSFHPEEALARLGILMGQNSALAAQNEALRRRLAEIRAIVAQDPH
jgi:hypothetical protein